MIIYPFKKGLASTAMLRNAGAKVRYGTSTVRQGIATAWGMKTMPAWAGNVLWVNRPDALSLVSDKLQWAAYCTALRDQACVIVPEFTTSTEQATEWAGTSRTKVLCRTELNSHSGQGITVARQAEEVIDAPLYTKYFRKNQEFRIVYGTACGVVYAKSKRRPADTEMTADDLLIRTKERGYVYQDEEDIPVPILEALSILAADLSSRGLSLLAYDVAYNSATEQVCIIEANTAWGMNEEAGIKTLAAMETIGETL